MKGDLTPRGWCGCVCTGPCNCYKLKKIINMQNIVVYGYGYVGHAVVNFLKDHYKVIVIDPHPPKYPTEDLVNVSWFPSIKNSAIPKTDLAIICVPTPMNKDGSADTSIVKEILRAKDHTHFMVKSTVVPGTCADLQKETGVPVVHCPEYIGEGNYEIPWWEGYPHPTDMLKHNFHLFGGDPEETQIWVRVWQKVAGWGVKYIQTSSRTTEYVKYLENMHLATLKVWWTEMFMGAKALGLNYDEVRELLLCDKRISRAMSLVYPDQLAYGGKCLPKDTNGIVQWLKVCGHDAKLWQAVIDRNEDFKDQTPKHD